MTPEEMGQRFVKAWHDAEAAIGDTVEQRIAQDIMDEACLPQHLYDQGVVVAMQAAIVAALRQMRESEREACAMIADIRVKTKPVSGPVAPLISTIVRDTGEAIARDIRARK